MPFLGAEPQSKATEAPPTLSAKNMWAMATGSSEGRWRCCSCSCCKNLTTKIICSAHTKFPLDRRRDSNYKHILIEITKLQGLLSVCVQKASRFVTLPPPLFTDSSRVVKVSCGMHVYVFSPSTFYLRFPECDIFIRVPKKIT